MGNLNEDVIRQIAEILPFEDLLTIRSLNSLWNSGVKPELAKHAKIPLNFKFTQWSLDQMERIRLDTNNFELLPKLYINIKSNKASKMDHYFEQCRTFFTKKIPRKIKKLVITMDVVDQKGIQLLVQILEHFSPFLEILKFMVLCSDELLDFAASLLSSIQFPKLNSFKLLSEGGSGAQLFCRVFFSVAPNIEKVKLIDLHKFYKEDVVLAPELLALSNPEDKSRNGLLPKLNSLALNLGFGSHYFFENFGQTFKNLSFGCVESFLCNLLIIKNRKPLETLNFKKLTLDSGIRLPNCPNLKNLELGIEINNAGDKLNFESEVVVYSEDFPKLKSLTIKNITAEHYIRNRGGGCMAPTYHSLFPPQINKICNSLRILVLPANCKATNCRMDGECDRKLGFLAQTKLPKMFPNARIIFKN